VFAYGLRLRVLLWIAAVDRVERAVVAACRWSCRGGRGLQVIATRVAGGGVAVVVKECVGRSGSNSSEVNRTASTNKSKNALGNY